MASSSGTFVNRLVTSKLISRSASLRMVSAKEEKIQASSLDKLYVGEPIAETIGLRGIPSLWTFGRPYSCGSVDAHGVKNSRFSLVISPFCSVSFSADPICRSIFPVGSFLSLLYVLSTSMISNLSSYSPLFVTTVALPLSLAKSQWYCFSWDPLLLYIDGQGLRFHWGVDEDWMTWLMCVLTFSAVCTSSFRAVGSVLVMISSVGRFFGVTAYVVQSQCQDLLFSISSMVSVLLFLTSPTYIYSTILKFLTHPFLIIHFHTSSLFIWVVFPVLLSLI